MRKPVIGIGGWVKTISMATDLREPAFVLNRRYVDAVARAGALPLILPYPDAAEALDVVDGLVLVGGADVDPASYGAELDPRTGTVDPERDGAEIALAKEAASRSTPTLAICRGAQVANVALGGTLVQHVDGHHESPGHGLVHDILASPGGRVVAVCGERFPGWSSHHQAIDRPGHGLVVTAHAPDGTPEAAELADRFFLAVQWHPERTAREDPRQLALFEALVREAARVR